MSILKTFMFAVIALMFFFSVPTTSFAHEEHKAEHKHPYPNTSFNLAKGETLYNQYCASCHGVKGDGKGPAAAALNPRPTDFLDLKYMPMRSRVDHYNVIAEGRPGTAMPPLKKTLSDEGIWSVIAYIEHLFNHQWNNSLKPMPENENHPHKH